MENELFMRRAVMIYRKDNSTYYVKSYVKGNGFLTYLKLTERIDLAMKYRTGSQINRELNFVKRHITTAIVDSAIIEVSFKLIEE